MIRAAVVDSPIEMPSLVQEVARDSNGATTIFMGTVRSANEGRSVTGIEYTAYEAMAVKEMTTILSEAKDQFQIDSAVIEHRVGSLGLGDASIAVAVSAPHRAAALDALRFIVDETKARAPIWKLEHYTDGTRQWVGAAASERRS